MKAFLKYPAHLINYSQKGRNPWAQDEIERLLELRANRVPYTKIARELGRTHRAILCKLAKYKLDN